MRKDARVFLDHILESIGLIERYTLDKTEKEFLSSVQLQDSVIRRIEVIGEAVKNLPDEIKTKHPKVPWKEIAGMRDILVHEYFGIDLGLTWEVVRRDMPDLRRKISMIRKTLVE